MGNPDQLFFQSTTFACSNAFSKKPLFLNRMTQKIPNSMNIVLKICLSTLLFIWQVSNAGAQLSDAQQKQADSLKALESSTLHDTLKTGAKLQLANLIAPYDSRQNEQLHLEIIEHCKQKITEAEDEKSATFYGTVLAASQGAIGVNYFLGGQFSKALEYELQSLDGCKKYNLKDKIGRCYIVIGAIHKSQGNYLLALENQRFAFKLNKKAGNKSGMALAVNNIGTALMEVDSLEKSIEAFRNCKRIYTSIGDKRGTGVALVNLGSAYKKKKVLDSAEVYFTLSLHIREEINDLQGLIFSNVRLGALLHQLNRNDEALVYAKKSLDLATQKGYPRGIRDANELLYKTYKAKEQYKEALSSYERHIAAKDSMADEEAIREVTKAQYTFQYEKELAEDSVRNAEEQKAIQIRLSLQELETQQQKQKSYFLWGGILLVLALGGFLYNRYKTAEKQKQTIEHQKAQVENALMEITKRDEEKELLLKEIHHRVKNNLQVVSSLLELQSKKSSEETKTAFTDGQNRVRAMALIHEKLYREENIADIDFDEYSRQLSQQIAAIYQTKKVDIQIKANGCRFDIDTAVPLGLILNELVTNAYKYAFGEAIGQLSISVEPKGNQGYELLVKDNGQGMPEDFDFVKAKSLGLRLVRRLSRQLYGSAEYNNQNGAEFKVLFKDTLQRKEVA